MPKIKDFFPAIKAAATAANPIAGAVVSGVTGYLGQKKERAKVMLEGKKTYIGIAVTAIPLVAKWFGFEVSAGFEENATLLANDIVSLIGLAITFYGRAVSKIPGMFAKSE